MPTKEELLQSLQNGVLMENEMIEFKRQLSHLNLPIIVKCVTAMANTNGGYIIIGIHETPKGGVVVGVDDESVRILNEQWHSALVENIIGVSPRVEVLEILQKKIILISVDKSEKVVYFSHQGSSPEMQFVYTRDKDGRLTIAEEMRYRKVYKYMTIESFLNCLYNKSWRFFEPNKWSDKFERRFYCADYKNVTSNNADTPQIYATCVTRTKNSEAAWKVYSHGQGLGSHCVQLELDVVELRKQLRASGLNIVEKKVNYQPEQVILDLHLKRSSRYTEYFTMFSLEKFISLLSLKRDAFQYENEIRLFAIPQNRSLARSLNSKALHHDITMDWKNVINGIRIDKQCSDAELSAIQNACFFAHINPIVHSYKFITGLAAPLNCKEVKFERFDIDEMPGRKHILIQ